MPRLLHQPPKYWLHKKTGQAVVKIAGRRIYLGKFGTPKSHELYEQAVAEWRRSQAKPKESSQEDELSKFESKITPASLRKRMQTGNPISINELILVFLKHSRRYYRKNGKLTREAGMIFEVSSFLRKHHGRLAAEKFGPVILKELREKMIEELDWSRKHLNKQVSRIVRMFKWAVENELVAPDVHAALDAVAGLKKGRTEARESEGVSCVPDAIVDNTVANLPEIVADMVRLQRLTGARPGEICSIRPGDIERSEEIWVYSPGSHKTEHHEQSRLIMIGPQAQVVLRPYLLRADDAYCFSPAESERKRHIKRGEERKTPPRKRDAKRIKRTIRNQISNQYSTDTYRHAVQRVCERLGITKWSPNQLRHTAATEIRKRYGIEAAQVVCGHRSADVTQVYAERDINLAKEIARKLG